MNGFKHYLLTGKDPYVADVVISSNLEAKKKSYHFGGISYLNLDYFFKDLMFTFKEINVH